MTNFFVDLCSLLAIMVCSELIKLNKCGGEKLGNLSKIDQARFDTVLKRLKKTQNGETICLAWWEVDLILKAICRKEKPVNVVPVSPWKK